MAKKQFIYEDLQKLNEVGACTIVDIIRNNNNDRVIIKFGDEKKPCEMDVKEFLSRIGKGGYNFDKRYYITNISKLKPYCTLAKDFDSQVDRAVNTTMKSNNQDGVVDVILKNTSLKLYNETNYPYQADLRLLSRYINTIQNPNIHKFYFKERMGGSEDRWTSTFNFVEIEDCHNGLVKFRVSNVSNDESNRVYCHEVYSAVMPLVQVVKYIKRMEYSN